MTTSINNLIEANGFANVLTSIERDAPRATRYLSALAATLGTDRDTWPDALRLLTEANRLRLTQAQQRLNELHDAMLIVLAIGTAAA